MGKRIYANNGVRIDLNENERTEAWEKISNVGSGEKLADVDLSENAKSVCREVIAYTFREAIPGINIRYAKNSFMLVPDDVSITFKNLKIVENGKEKSYAEHFGIEGEVTKENADALVAHLALNLTVGPLAKDKNLKIKYNEYDIIPATDEATKMRDEDIKREEEKGKKPEFPGFFTWLKASLAKVFRIKNSQSVQIMDEYKERLKEYNLLVEQENEKIKQEKMIKIKQEDTRNWNRSFLIAEDAIGIMRANPTKETKQRFENNIKYLREHVNDANKYGADKMITDLEKRFAGVMENNGSVKTTSQKEIMKKNGLNTNTSGRGKRSDITNNLNNNLNKKVSGLSNGSY